LGRVSNALVPKSYLNPLKIGSRKERQGVLGTPCKSLIYKVFFVFGGDAKKVLITSPLSRRCVGT